MRLNSDAKQYEKRLVLTTPQASHAGLPYLVWSAGQREFVPMLMGMYWLIPASKISKRADVEWVIVEEPEMGLHADAIAVTILLLLELMSRGYKVVLSTHSPQLLDVVWAIRKIRESENALKLFRSLFQLENSQQANGIAEKALDNKEYRVYAFSRNGTVQDISDLDPCSDNVAEAGWGGLTEFSGRAADIVGGVV